MLGKSSKSFICDIKSKKTVSRNVEYIAEGTTQEIQGKVWGRAINQKVIYTKMVFHTTVKDKITQKQREIQEKPGLSQRNTNLKDVLCCAQSFSHV